ncbi:glycosyltransferase [Bacillus coagulans]|uniref:glycosyltransferase family 2 protein n=1 Tax=Heyndrickxia coagulans TaxID=1398 RepID=UPI001377B746|nr:glycosyltransferase family 2 protein [Heyndrickxia coagulans]NCG69194.1 glycosyltransferase [Heyndrickxia coagulans]
MGPLISVIIPVFNVERYLKRCLDSVINQTYKKLEIILVNDGSTDKSGEICDSYASIDKRVKVIHKKNGGLSDARNVGLLEATGDFVSFIDSDDFIHKDMYKIMYSLMTEKKGDIVEVGYQKFSTEMEIEEPDYHKQNIDIYPTKKAVINTILDHNCRNYVWNKLYKIELWEDIKFPYRKVFEDIFTTHKIISKANKVVKTNLNLYYYFQRNDSIVNSGFSINKSLQHCEAVGSMIKFMKEKYPDLLPLAYIKYYIDCFIRLYEIINNRKKIKDSNIIIHKLSQQMLGSSIFIKDNEEIKNLCKKYLGYNYDIYLKKRKKMLVELYLLNKSITAYYIFKKSTILCTRTKNALLFKKT